MESFVKEVRHHLETKQIPFWERLKDEEYGGYYGYMDYDLRIDKKYEKGCILNSRILWFFSNTYMLLKKENLREDAVHAYCFLKEHCLDEEYGGVFWSVTYDGQVKDDTKHTYNQAFAVYALSSYYDAVKDEEALKLAMKLKDVIEEKCTDSLGYLEAFTRDFKPADNEKLYSGIGAKEILIDSDYQISCGDKQFESIKESSYEKFFFNWQAGEIDAMIMPESFFEYCRDQGGEFMEERIPIRETRMGSMLTEEAEDPVFLVFAAVVLLYLVFGFGLTTFVNTFFLRRCIM